MAKEGVGAISYEPHTSGGAGDAIDTINRRMEFQERLSRRIAEASGMLDEATALLYGEDDHGGLAKLKGNRYATCFAWPTFRRCRGRKLPKLCAVRPSGAASCRRRHSRSLTLWDLLRFVPLEKRYFPSLPYLC
mgnify:CR=1 FL=1